MTGHESVGQHGTFLDHVGGIEWLPDGTDPAVRLVLAAEHLNPNGTAHGGVILTLLDFALGATVERSLPPDLIGHPITIQLATSMIGAARRGELLEATATVDAATRTMTFVSGVVRCDDRIIATASAVFRNPRNATA